MRLVWPGNFVLHLIDNRQIAGVSIAADVTRPGFVGFPGTEWENRPCYRTQLQHYTPLDPPIAREEFLDVPSTREVLGRIQEEYRK
jgi:hypothetical protein